MRLFLPAVVLVPLLMASMAMVADAQDADRRERRRQLMDNLLQSLIESQQPGQPAAERPVPRHPAPTQGALRDAQRYVDGFSQESSHLIDALRREERYRPEMRPLMADALKVKAMADVFAQRGRTVRDPAALANEFKPLDQQWRTLSHRLRQYDDLDKGCLSHVAKLDQFDQQLCGLFSIEPQLQRDELSRQLVQLSADMNSLLKDADVELRNSKYRDQMLRDGRALQSQVNTLYYAVHRGEPYERVVAIYRGFATGWWDFVAKLRRHESRYLQRSISRVDDRRRAVQELLWIPHEIQRGHIRHCSELLVKDWDAFLDGVTLRSILAVDQPDGLLTGVGEFSEMCGGFAKSCEGDTGIDDLHWDYGPLNVQWQTVQSAFGACEDATLRRQLAVLGQDMLQLQESLGIQADRTFDEALALAAHVDTLSDELARNMQTLIGQSRRYPSQFRDQAVRTAARFHESAHGFHDAVGQRGGLKQLRDNCAELSEHWQRVRGELARCQGNDKLQLARTSSQIAPAMAKLQLIFDY